MSSEEQSEPDDYSLRPAHNHDAVAVAKLVEAAYEHYIEQIGMVPGPMTLDYGTVIADRHVTVAERDGHIIGVLVLCLDHDSIVIENVAVLPAHRGMGVGRALLAFAEDEAVRSGYGTIHLYTHELMTENVSLYSRIGYVEYKRSDHDSFRLVHMRKRVL